MLVVGLCISSTYHSVHQPLGRCLRTCLDARSSQPDNLYASQLMHGM